VFPDGISSELSPQARSRVQSQRPSTIESHLATVSGPRLDALRLGAVKDLVVAEEDKLQVEDSAELRVTALDTKQARHKRRQRRSCGQQSTGGELTYVVPSRRRSRVIQREVRSRPDLVKSFDMHDAARSVRKAKALTRSLCKPVEVNMWPEQRYNTVEAVLLRRRALRIRASDFIPVASQ
jgi:hypothetical protein